MYEQEKKNKKSAEQLASEAAAALLESAKQAAADSENLRAVQAAELVFTALSSSLQACIHHVAVSCFAYLKVKF